MDRRSVSAASKDAPETKAPRSAPNAATVEAASVAADALIQSCRQICEKTASLSCSAHARCPDACVQSFSVSYCRAEMTKFIECTKSAGVESFECSPDGFAALKDGFCDKEQAQIVRCLERIEAQ